MGYKEVVCHIIIALFSTNTVASNTYRINSGATSSGIYFKIVVEAVPTISTDNFDLCFAVNGSTQYSKYIVSSVWKLPECLWNKFLTTEVWEMVITGGCKDRLRKPSHVRQVWRVGK